MIFTSLLIRIWDFISGIARVIVAADDAMQAGRSFWDWFVGKEPVEPETKQKIRGEKNYETS